MVLNVTKWGAYSCVLLTNSGAYIDSRQSGSTFRTHTSSYRRRCRVVLTGAYIDSHACVTNSDVYIDSRLHVTN